MAFKIVDEEYHMEEQGRNPEVMGYVEGYTSDAVPAVRCRECIAYTPVDDKTGKCIFLIGEHQYVVPDGYCYLGERKEGADNEP